MRNSAVRTRATLALALAGLLVLPLSALLPATGAAVVGFLLALAVVRPPAITGHAGGS